VSEHPDPRPKDDTDALRLRLEMAEGAVEAAAVEARRRVRLNEGR